MLGFNRRDLQRGERLAMPLKLARIIAAPLLEHQNLFVTTMVKHSGLDRGASHIGGADGDGTAADHQYFVERNFTANGSVDFFNTNLDAFFHAELFAARFYNRVHGQPPRKENEFYSSKVILVKAFTPGKYPPAPLRRFFVSWYAPFGALYRLTNKNTAYKGTLWASFREKRKPNVRAGGCVETLKTYADTFIQYVDLVNGLVWGPYVLLPLLAGTGLYLMAGLRFMPWLNVGVAFRHMWRGRKHDAEHEGELSPFNALMTSMAATVGTGNIVGVATAIMTGGPGAVFWMWVTALVGMATKYCEALLAVKYRETTPNGSFVGGPMYYIKNGLGKNWAWMAVLFSVFGAVASFGIGNMTQTNAIAGNLSKTFDLPEWSVAVLLLVLVGIVLLGGVKRIGAVAGMLVPFMAIFYIGMGLIILALNYEKVGPAFLSIFEYAFAPAPAVGGFAGASIMLAMRYGMARGMFSNEAGLGSAPIAHATAITNSPVRQGFLGMLDPFIDTILVCSITALVILISGEWVNAPKDTEVIMTSSAFGQGIPFGEYIVTAGLVLFAFSTILGWSVYGERCCIYLFGHKAALPFRILFTLVVPLGAMAKISFVWKLSDLFNGLMALPNLVALLLLSPVVFRMTRTYFENQDIK